MKHLFLASTLFPAMACAQPGQSHVHGTGQLGITFSGAEYSLSLTVPAADILGFEHQAETDEDRALVAGAISALSEPLDLFLPPDEALCFAVSANVTLSQAGAEAEGSQEYHSEFRAEYQIQCQVIEEVDHIRFIYFERFQRADKLTVFIESAGAQKTHNVSRATPSLSF
ncbi:ZrgA family zinc uptake protein [Ruegeria sp.]|uniref:ZrgA family zinc uptake protein n=1 Tax=Ruegeria sp. TaxID=1879320 RepID=UPI003B59EAAE